MAEIFLAKSRGAHGFRKNVVIKRILPSRADSSEFVNLFIAEAKTMMRLEHPKVVQVLDFGEVDGRYFIAMEYVRGTDCGELLRSCAMNRCRPIPVIAVHIVADVLEALDYAHNLRDDDGRPLEIVHRDISPSNVFISEHGQVKLSDFGIATIGGSGRRQNGKVIRGKYGYLAPEVVTGGPVDHRADIFSAGIVLAELLMVQRLFYSKNYVDILLQVRDARLERLDKYGKHIPPELREILEYALARNPGLRYQTAEAFRNALHHYLFRHQRLLRSTSVKRFVKQLGVAGEPSPSRPAVLEKERIEEGSTQAAHPISRAAQGGASGSGGEAEKADRQQGREKRRSRLRMKVGPPPSPGPVPMGRSRQKAMARLSAEDALMAVTPTEDARSDEQVEQFLGADGIESLRLPSRSVSEPASGPVSERDAASRRVSTAEMSTFPPPDLEGDLSETSLFAVLFPLAVDATTGLLTLRKGDTVKEIFLKDGDPHYVSSNRTEELFGQYLLRTGVLTRDELDRALSVLPQHKGKLGETLVALEVLRPMQMLRLLTRQVRHKMLNAFKWRSGTYAYYAGQTCRAEAAPLGLDAFELIDAGVKELSDDELASRLSPAIGKRPQAVRPPPVPPEVFRVDAFPREVYDELDGTRTLEELLTPGGRFDDIDALGRVIYMLCECGLATLE